MIAAPDLLGPPVASTLRGWLVGLALLAACAACLTLAFVCVVAGWRRR